MTNWSNVLVIVAVAVVALVVLAGFVNMFRGGAGAPARAQKLMRWRVGLQLIALLIVLGVLYARGRW